MTSRPCYENILSETLPRPAVLKADSQGILAVPGHEWAVFRLGRPGAVTIVEVDTNHFKVSLIDAFLFF